MKKFILFSNSMGARPGAGREYRLVDPETLATVYLIISDDSGSGARDAEDCRHSTGIKENWEHIWNMPVRVKSRYQEQFTRQLTRKIMDSMTASDNEQYKADLDGISNLSGAYPVLLRGGYLDSKAQIFDVRRYHAVEKFPVPANSNNNEVGAIGV